MAIRVTTGVTTRVTLRVTAGRLGVWAGAANTETRSYWKGTRAESQGDMQVPDAAVTSSVGLALAESWGIRNMQT